LTKVPLIDQTSECATKRETVGVSQQSLIDTAGDRLLDSEVRGRRTWLTVKRFSIAICALSMTAGWLQFVWHPLLQIHIVLRPLHTFQRKQIRLSGRATFPWIVSLATKNWQLWNSFLADILYFVTVRNAKSFLLSLMMFALKRRINT